MKANNPPAKALRLNLGQVLAACLIMTTRVFGFAGGDGSPEDPYQVATAGHLDTVRDHLDAHFIQTADINLGVAPWNQDEGWEPIGDWDSPFTGNYDGNGYTIAGLQINRPNQTRVGLFGSIQSAVVKNVELINPNVIGYDRVGAFAGDVDGTMIKDVVVSGIGQMVTGRWSVGGLAGSTRDSRIEACSTGGGSINGNGMNIGGLIGSVDFGSVVNNSHSSVNVFSSSSYVGGLAGSNNGRINNCYATGNVVGTSYVGGLIGENFTGSVNVCHSSGEVDGTGSHIGGLVGLNTEGNIRNSYSHASVSVDSDTDQVGGFVGRNIRGEIFHSFSTGEVDGGSENIGGFIGSQGEEGKTIASYWDIELSQMDDSAAGEGLTTAQMMTQTTYTDWDFETFWTISDGESYPHFGEFLWHERNITFYAIDAFGNPINGARIILSNDVMRGIAPHANENGMVELILPIHTTHNYYASNTREFNLPHFLGEGQFEIAEDEWGKTIEIKLSLVTFTVVDQSGIAVPNAELYIPYPFSWGGNMTGDDGVFVIQSPKSMLNYTVTANGYIDVENEEVEISEDTASILVELYSSVPVTIHLNYTYGAGGYLTGELNQIIETGESGDEVHAVAQAGAEFSHWSDGRSDNPRVDADVQADLEVTAFFRSEGGVEIEWYAEHGITPEGEQTWADLDSIDLSGKGKTLREEFIAGTDPTDTQSRFAATTPAADAAGFEIDFQPSLPDRLYSLYRSTDLNDWNPVPGMQDVPGGNGPLADNDPPDGAVFYRIKVTRP